MLCVPRSWHMQCNHRRDETIHPLFRAQRGQNKWKHVIAKHGLGRSKATREQWEREKSFVRHTQFVMNYHTRSDVLSREKGISPALSCILLGALSRADNMEFGSGGDENAPHTNPSIHPYAVSSPRKRCLHSIPKEMCSRKTRKGRNAGIRARILAGDKSAHAHKEREGNRPRTKFYLDKSSSTNDFILFT